LEFRVFRTIRTGSPRRSTLIVATCVSTRLPADLRELDVEYSGAITEAIADPAFSGRSGTTSSSANVLVVGLGEKKLVDLEAVRKSGSVVRNELEQRGDSGAAIEIHHTIPASVGTAEEIGQAFAEGVAISNWSYSTHRGTASEKPAATGRLALASSSSDVRAGLRRGLILSEGVNAARQLAATPPNICHPGWVAAQARKMARASGLHCRVIGVAEARKMGMGGLLTVGQGSIHKPCLIVLEHRPVRPRTDERLVFVGKTITYDTGGYSLKTGNGMKGMKYDMCGGAAVFGAMQAIAALKLPIRVAAVLPCAENMVSDRAYRPDDIITMSNGVTVEVTNTDAEGRLVLGDALAYACSKLKPTRLVDLATLTGGVVVGLGHFCAGMWCNDRALRRSIESASEASGERVWRMPLWEEHRQFMRSRHADLWNSAPSRNAHPIQGAAFLSYFVDQDVPWCHLDIAGTASTEKDTDMCSAGPTGFGVRLCAALAAGLASS
jgi:leucyl aminopeptidase